METEQLRALLERFYEGKTSREEEETLRRTLLETKVQEEFAADREFFLAMREDAATGPSPAFTRKLEELVDEHYAAGSTAKVIPLRRRLLRAVPVAASLLLVLATYFFFLSRKPKDTFQDPQLAYQETKRILLYVSQKFNQGTHTLSYLDDLSLPAREMRKVGEAARIVDHIPYLRLPGESPVTSRKNEKNKINQ